MNLVDAGLGITIVPELLAQNLPPARRAAQVRRFGDPEPKREISFLVTREHLRRAITDALFTVLESGVARELQSRSRRPNVIAPTTKRSA
jgi:LysR family transcriptional regulator, hydrogen peroxide-inducible genes activator